MKNESGAVTYWAIDPVQAGQRIDNYLRRLLKGVPKSHIYQLLRSGQVRVNQGRVKADYRLAAGDSVRIPPVRRADAPPAFKASTRLIEQLERMILLETEDLIGLNKPAGLAVHGGSGISYGVIEVLRAARPNAPGLELAHRLDRGTSGCLMLAKHRGALTELNQHWCEGQVEKTYLALVAGRWPAGAQTITAPLGPKDPWGKVTVAPSGKLSESHFVPLKYFKNATLLRIRIETGRMHQIRVHAAFVGHPVAGDTRYGDYPFNRSLKAQGLNRLFLHAEQLRLGVGSRLDFTLQAPLDAALQAVLDHWP